MPKYLFLFLGLFSARQGIAQLNQVTAKPPLTHVTVYLDGLPSNTKANFRWPPA